MKNNRTFLEKLLDGAEVEWKKLCEVSEIEKGKQLNKALLAETGEYPVINGGINPSGYWHEYNNEANTIVISQGGASAGYVNWMTTPFFAGAHAYVVKANETLVQKRYAYHFLKMNQVKFMQNQYGAGIPALAKSDLANLLIPIPPLSVQTEIVRILDALTALTSELTSELILRQKQYEYYREKLLSFDSLELLGGGSPMGKTD
nr:restriction endonuclease subunit S [Haemophilus haemolyticus]